jgi:hypothetical protein
VHQPASEKAKVETKPRFHAGRLDAGVLWLFIFLAAFFWLVSFIIFFVEVSH